MRDSVNLKYSFFYLAAFVVIIAGIKIASNIVVLLFLSIFISSIFLAILKKLSSFSIPKIGSYIIVVTIFSSIVLLFFYIASTSLNDFLKNIPLYEQGFYQMIVSLLTYLDNYNLNIEKDEFLKMLDIKALFALTTNMLGNVGSWFSKLLVIFIGVAFILSESDSFAKKIEHLSKDNREKLKAFYLFSANIQRYFIIKTMTSFLTGFFIFIALLLFDIEYPLLWAVVAFVFNFIPVIGSIVAAFPAILLALFKADISVFLWLSLIYMVINISISNVLEPKFMGDGLGLSATVIFFSLIFWGYVLGIAGMFLAVPITMTIKIASDSMQSTKWLSLLLSKR